MLDNNTVSEDHPHVCLQVCAKTLACGKHKCERRCHLGRCPPCMHGIFEEITCRCGRTVIEPPIPCGTEPPRCPFPCTVVPGCGHPPRHGCHFDACPPCVEMVYPRCGSHGTPLKWPVPCHMQAEKAVCGTACNRRLPCGRHLCKKLCHSGPCDPCGSVCGRPLPCGHPCAVPCHPGACDMMCKGMRLVLCQCGRQQVSMTCLNYNQALRDLVLKGGAKRGTLPGDLPVTKYFAPCDHD
eukprot:Sspe_Gene.89245::Locus_61056_Transcript_1_1_Confidence_1.000_Length_2160::g.89245::m.89245/K12236/NFX1; transcriptional repressor NF-X1